MRILLAEDSIVSQRLLMRVLQKWGYEVDICENGDTAWEKMQRPEKPSLVILDWIMPGLSGPEICRKLRQNPKTNDTYAILLTAKEDKASIIEGLEAGADDYIKKPFDNDELRARIRVGQRVVRLREELADKVRQVEAANRQLEALSSLDPLTGIANRRSFDVAMNREWRRALRNKTPLSFLMVDIDFFKSYNDTYGHLSGDECLVKVANILRESMERGSDLVARYGGEEFAILAPDVGPQAVSLLGEKLRDAVWKAAIPHEKSEVCPLVTISIGCASYAPDLKESMENISNLIEKADEALYTAKSAGRNCCVGAVIPVKR